MSHPTNIVRIKTVASSLGDLISSVVFVGGATISLYTTRQVFEVRPTDDVDVIIEILNYTSRVALEEKLREMGFEHDIESGVVCRFRIQGVTVDIIPTKDASVGFTNIWYPEGYTMAIPIIVDERCTIKILSSPYFLATKLEAFKSRGKRDGRTSHDFEDIIYVFENRTNIWEEMSNAPESVKNYLQAEFSLLLKNGNIREWIDGHVERGSPPATQTIIDNLKKFCG